jgi:hypothetical protein
VSAAFDPCETPRVRTRIPDKKTGKLLFDQEAAPAMLPSFHTLTADERSGVAEAIHYAGKLRIEPRSP